MTTKTLRRTIEKRRDRYESLLPPEIVAIVESDTGVMTTRIPECHRWAADQLRKVTRQLATY